MKNITLSADENLIAKAREQAKSRNTTLNEEFRRWLERYARSSEEGERRALAYRRMMDSMADISLEAPVSREEMNER